MEQNMLKVEEVETDTEQFKITDLKECDETDLECEEEETLYEEETPVYKHIYYTKARTEEAKKKSLIKHVKTLLNIKSSNRVYHIVFGFDRIYFDTEKPDCRSIQIDYKLVEKGFIFEVIYHPIGNNVVDWIKL